MSGIGGNHGVPLFFGNQGVPSFGNHGVPHREMEPIRALPLRVYNPADNIIYQVDQTFDFFKLSGSTSVPLSQVNHQNFGFFKHPGSGSSSKPPRKQPKEKKTPAKPKQPRREIPPWKTIPGEYQPQRDKVPADWFVEGKRRDSDWNLIDWKFIEPTGPDGIKHPIIRSIKGVEERLEKIAAEKGKNHETINVDEAGTPVAKKRKEDEASGAESSHSGVAQPQVNINHQHPLFSGINEEIRCSSKGKGVANM